jgi:hypothetical protein
MNFVFSENSSLVITALSHSARSQRFSAVASVLDFPVGLAAGGGDASAIPLRQCACFERVRSRRVNGPRGLSKARPLEPCVYRALKLGSDTVVIGLLDAPDGDPIAVPAGNRTRAWLVRSKGNAVVPWNAWPNTLTFQEQASDRVVWAVVTRPSVSGKWLLRMPAGGQPAFFAIPSRQGALQAPNTWLSPQTGLRSASKAPG